MTLTLQDIEELLDQKLDEKFDVKLESFHQTLDNHTAALDGLAKQLDRIETNTSGLIASRDRHDSELRRIADHTGGAAGALTKRCELDKARTSRQIQMQYPADSTIQAALQRGCIFISNSTMNANGNVFSDTQERGRFETGKWFVENNRSAYRPRPCFRRMLSELETPKAHIVITDKRERFSRNLADSCEISRLANP